MNWEHFKAFVWLRWRLLYNQLTRGGVINVVLFVLFAVGAVAIACFGALIAFTVGLLALRDASAEVLMYAWDGVVFGFLFCWMMGLLVQLQRAEVLSLDRFLHLPVSLFGAFLINYLSSLLSLTLIVFLPGMVALAVALVLARGPAMLLLLPTLAAFVLMVTALTYQFQGWLAAIMTNPRRRRTVIVLVTMAFVLSCQAPNLINLLRPAELGDRSKITADIQQKRADLEAAHAAGQVTDEAYQRRLTGLVFEEQQRLQELDQRVESGMQTALWIGNVVLPPAWLALGAWASAEGNVLVALAAFLGMALIGAGSLWRAYRTTVRLYTGQFTSGARAPARPAPKPEAAGAAKESLLEWRLPWLSEPASAVALGGFRSLLRAPEAKMLLLTPFLMLIVFGSLFIAKSVQIPDWARPLPAFGVTAMTMFSLIQVVANQFGFDRSGFRVFVLSSAPRRDILLGKNLAAAPVALVLSAVGVIVVEIFSPMRIDHLLATVPRMVSMFLLFCLVANLLSILAPMPIRAGSLRPANPKLLPQLLYLAFTFVFPLAMLPLLLPLGLELLLAEVAGLRGWPIDLALSLLVCGGVVLLYRLVLPWQGDLLQARELKILDTVTTRTE